MKTIYTATAPAHASDDDKRPHLFVSLDDAHYLEIETPFTVTADRYDEIAQAFAGERWTDSEGHEHRRGRISTAKRWLMFGSQLDVTFHEPILVPEATA